MANVPVAVVIPTFQRPNVLAATLVRIAQCEPAPAEVLVHVDDGDTETVPMLRERFPTVVVLTSDRRMGPGGGRNKLVRAANYDIVASFDDDSFPVDLDYFARLFRLFAEIPDAAAIASQITEKGHVLREATASFGIAFNFGGGGVAYRRAHFLASGGYVDLSIAYGMEEVDLCIRFTDQQRRIYYSPWLRVYHDNDLTHHADAQVTSASISNVALLVFLRYPKSYWPYGFGQVMSRIVWLMRVGRRAGILSGILHIPHYLWRRRVHRAPVRSETLRMYLRARRSKVQLHPFGA